MKLPRSSAHRYESRVGKGIARVMDIFAAMVVCVALLFGATQISRLRSAKTDYSTKPPAQVFEMVLNQRVPRGVSGIRVSGFALLSGAHVWMKFAATDAALKAILRSSKLSFSEPSDEIIPISSQKSPEGDSCERAIGWQNAFQLDSMSAYSYTFASPDNAWQGTFIIDRKKNIVYVQAGAL